MHPVQPKPVPDACLVLCSHCRAGMGGRKEWGSRRWPLVPLHGCCGACKDGFVLKNHSPMYTGAGGGGSCERVRNACVRCWHLSYTACPLQRPRSLQSFSITSCNSPPCMKCTCHPWISMGAKAVAVIPTTCPLHEQQWGRKQHGRFFSCCRSTSSWCEYAGEVSGQQGARRWMGLDVLEAWAVFLLGLSVCGGMTDEFKG